MTIKNVRNVRVETFIKDDKVSVELNVADNKMDKR